MTDDNPVTDEMVHAFRLEASGLLNTQDFSTVDELWRSAIWAAIKAGGFVSAEKLRDEMAERVAEAARLDRTNGV